MAFTILVLLLLAIIVWLNYRDNRSSAAIEALEQELRAERQKRDEPAPPQHAAAALPAEAGERPVEAAEAKDDASPYAGLSQKDFVLKILDELECSHHEMERDNGGSRIWVGYQGGNFWIDMDDESAWITCIMPGIADASLDDLDSLSLTRRAVNEENCRPWSWYVFYSIDTEERKMNVHLFSHFVVTPRMVEAKPIFEAYLIAAFKRQRSFYLERDRLAAEGAPAAQAH